jgi:CubicO group peptidase (beta-lactamase class C family)
MRISHFFIVFIILAIFSCSGDDINPEYVYTEPQQIDDGLEVSTLDSAGIDKELITYMADNIKSNRYVYIHSVLICRNNKLVFEEYFNGCNRNTLNNIYSVTKSFCSALTGIAIDRQYIKNVNDPIRIYLPQYNDIDWTGKDKITIFNLLTMSSGLEWDEDTAPYRSAGNSHTKMSQSPEQVKYVLQRPLVSEPGTRFTYNSGGVVVLGKIIENSIDMELDTFATRFLFRPLGINKHKWYIYPSGIYLTSGDLQLTSRDMAKFGLLYLNRGKWKGQQIISEDWIEQSVKSYISPWYETYYGYLWWKNPFLLPNGQRIEAYAAEGFGGQLIFVLPTYKMVVVFTSGINWNQEELLYQPFEMLQQFILPSIQLVNSN